MALITTEVELCNMALARVGHKKITALTDDNKAARQCNLHYSNERDNMMAAYPWPFAIKRDRLTAAGIINASAITITITGNTAPTADTIVDSSSTFITSGFENGDRVTIVGSDSNNNTYDVDTVIAGTLTLDPQMAATSETLTNDTDLKLFAAPAFKYAYKYAVPTDILTPLSVNQLSSPSKLPTWEHEGAFIITNEKDANDQIDFYYTKRITDVALFSSDFVRVLYLKIASQLAIVLANSNTLWEAIILELVAAKKEAKFTKGYEGEPDNTPADSDFGWMLAR